MKEYIEREAVIEAIKNHKCESKVVYSIAEVAYCVGQEIGEAIRSVPAADVVEVRHGRWDDSGRYKFPNGETAVCCTECGCALRKKEYENNNWFYCPVCGAKMDKEE